MASTHTIEVPTLTDALPRVLAEGYGPGAWHGPDLKAALDGVTAEEAFKRPAAGRHNVAEIALHHAFCVRSVRAKLTGEGPGPFLLDGEDWFELTGKKGPSWNDVKSTLESEQEKLAKAVDTIAKGGAGGASPLPETERFDLVLGITCHAVYHAGQVQLVKKLNAR